jgi:transposase InsO family protein
MEHIYVRSCDGYCRRMTQPTRVHDGHPGPHLRATRGDGSPLASFLCPVCRHDVLVEEVACDHLLLVRDRFGEVYCRDGRVRELHRQAEREAGERGERAIERLCERLGPTVVLYELLDPPREQPRGASTLFVVDVGDDRRHASGA